MERNGGMVAPLGGGAGVADEEFDNQPGKGEYSTARSGGGVLDKSTIDRIMLRFRPIAPKPAGNGSSSGEATPECDNNKNILTSKRTKRKYVRVRKKNKPRKKKKTPSPEGGETKNPQHKSFETLQLLPERSDGEELLLWSNVIESRVTVECVTDTCAADGDGLGSTDEDRLRNLEADACPGFVSDGSDAVQWVNEAYKKMVTSAEENDGIHGFWKKEFRVCLVMKVKVPCKCSHPAFGCRVRVDYTWHDRKLSRTVPGDVWRMECGWFAWRLDVKSALSLGI
ncbi:hypothetical protein RHSIM_Rhsim08G0045500 [Rhododendron simsii]|uniref:DUF7950 domain-containing protein n=1 Tax=Rhododendron simsii TaxID=118357 RepID=A0A834LH60_RHOSS|nr:hypothetical protein RHSIM_Rhsim08G0045500 [Rhododendron simsii]